MERMNFKRAAAAMLAAALLAAGSAWAADAAPAASGDGKPFLADRHIERGLDCKSCHGDKAPTADVDMSACLKCHGGSYQALAKQTESDDINPHATHLGEAQCVTCHQGHKPPRLSCDNCHEFDDIRVP